MDQNKIGRFICDMRKQRGMTQEQLGETLGVTNKTVSRWETGSNMPDLSTLVELANFYNVDIREIIEGGRKADSAAQQQTPDLLPLVDYSRHRERLWVRQLLLQSICGILAWGISLVLMLRFSEVSDGIPLLLGMEFVCVAIYTGVLYLIPANRTANGCIAVLTAGFCAITASNLTILGIFFGSGSYHNWGLIGIWYCAAVFFTCFLTAGATVTVLNGKYTRKD